MANAVNYVPRETEFLTVMSSAARTTDPDTEEFRDLGYVAGLIVIVDVTAIVATPALTIKIQGVDPTSGKTWDILTSVAIATAVTTVLKVRPGITPAANTAVADMVPPIIRITATHGDTDSITYSITACLDRS